MLTVLAAASVLASILLTHIIKRRFSNHLLDIPNDRSSHTQPTPRGGGLGFILAFAITGLIATLFASSFPQLLSHPLINPNPTVLWLILTPLAIIGIIDDRQGLPARIRYLVHLSVASLAIAGFGSFPLPWLTDSGLIGQIIAIALTLIGITALFRSYCIKFSSIRYYWNYNST